VPDNPQKPIGRRERERKEKKKKERKKKKRKKKRQSIFLAAAVGCSL